MEVEVAESLGIPVFHSVMEVQLWAATQTT
jgi:hypothetical protein